MPSETHNKTTTLSITNKPEQQKNSRKSHICHIESCQKGFRSKHQLLDHITSKHIGDNLNVCCWMNCNQSFLRVEDLKQHVLEHACEKKFSCSQCNKKFSKFKHMRRHVEKIHSQINIRKTVNK